MKVKELIEKLKKADPEAMVVMSYDSEGNGYNKLRDVETDNQAYCHGEIGFKKLTPELEKRGYGEGDLLEDGEDAVVLWP